MTAERQTQSVRAMKATLFASWIVIYAIWMIMEAHTVMTPTHLAISGPFDLRGPFYRSLIVIRACGHADAP